MKYYTISYLWVIPIPIIINILILYTLLNIAGSGNYIEILPLVILLLINNLFAYYGLKYTLSKKPTLELNTDHLRYRGLYKNYTINYSDIRKVARIHEDTISRNDKYMTRISLYVKFQKRPLYIMPRIIKGDNTEIFKQIESRISD